MSAKPLGAAFQHAQASGKDQNKAAVRRRANAYLLRQGHSPMSRKVAKGILDRWRAMSTDERADEFNLRAAGVPADVARALAMSANGKAPKRKPKFGGLISKMGPTLAELGAAGHSTGLTGSQAFRGATWRKRRAKRIDKAADAIVTAVMKGGPGSGPRPGGGASIATHLSAARSHLAAARAARGKGDHATADTHQQKASERIRAALRSQSVSKGGGWDESKHPRADNGEFGEGGGGGSADGAKVEPVGARKPRTTRSRAAAVRAKPAPEPKTDHKATFAAEHGNLSAPEHRAKAKEHLDEARGLYSALRERSLSPKVVQQTEFAARKHFAQGKMHEQAAEKLDPQPSKISEHASTAGLPAHEKVAIAHQKGKDARAAYKRDDRAEGTNLFKESKRLHEEAAGELASQDGDIAIAHTRSGKAITMDGRHDSFTEDDHKDALEAHANLLSKFDGHSAARNRSFDALKTHERALENAASGFNQTAALGQTKSGKPVSADSHVGQKSLSFDMQDHIDAGRMHYAEAEKHKPNRRLMEQNGRRFFEDDAASRAFDHHIAANKFHNEKAIAMLTGETVGKAAVMKRHMVSQLADQYIAAAYEPPRLPAGEPAYTDPPEFARYLDAQRLVAGMDVETAAGAETPSVARERASRALATGMGHYDRAIAGPDRSLAHVGGLNLDLGSGQARERGFLGVDTYPFDYGTVVHDLSLGIPFPDGSARAVRLHQALPALEDYRDDATALMLEVQRVLTIGGRFYYQGPPLQRLVDWSKLPGLGVVSHQFTEGGQQLALTLQRQAARLPVVYGADPYQLGRAETCAADMAESMAEFGQLPAADVAMANLVAKSHVDVQASIIKKRDYDRVVLGPILIPDLPDSQNDTMTARDIEETAHNFLADARLVGREHSDTWEGAQVVESYIAPCELSFADEMYGPQVVPKGSWILGVRIPEESWADVLDGSVTGFSVGGWGEREEVTA